MTLSITLDQIQILKSQLNEDGNVLCPGSIDYESNLKRWSAIGLQFPRVIVCPINAQGIGTAVRFARDHNIDLAVQGGRHSTDSSASSNGGILIDLGSMKQITVNKTTKTIQVQGGAKWADVYQMASQYGLAVVGGTVSQVGVGGLTLRGGYGFLTPQHGLVIDNLLSAKVVTADGKELEANEVDNRDLFWALRGAGQTVGVVTEFEFQAYDQWEPVWSGIRSYTGDKILSVMEALNTALVHPEGKAAAQAILALSPDTSTGVISTALFFDGPENEARNHFAQLLELEYITDDVRMRNYADANFMLDPAVPPGGRKKILGVHLTLPVRPEFSSLLLKTVSQQLLSEPDMKQSCLAIDYLDPSSIRNIPVTETAFPSRGKFLNGALILQWNDPRKDESIVAWGESIQKLCDDEMRQAGCKPFALVSNFFGYTPDDQVTAVNMFGINARRLLAIKEEHDPENVFNKLNPLDAQGDGEESS